MMRINMEYCRFENTARALAECAEAQPFCDGAERLSKSEQQSWKDLKELMVYMLEEEGYTVEGPKS